MQRRKNIRRVLITMADVFSSCAVECAYALFNEKCEIHMPWEVVEQLQGQFDNLLTMGSGSEKFSALTCAGIQYDSLNAFLHKEDVNREYAADALGEFVNSYCGLLADNDKFRKHFGTHIQAVPILYTDGHSFLPFIWGVQGYLYIKEHWIYIGYTIRENIASI
jgi:hypothetical protein